jgi:hypothetical protein
MQSRPIVYSIKEAYHVARRTTTCAMIECPFYAFLGPRPQYRHAFVYDCCQKEAPQYNT